MKRFPRHSVKVSWRERCEKLGGSNSRRSQSAFASAGIESLELNFTKKPKFFLATKILLNQFDSNG